MNSILKAYKKVYVSEDNKEVNFSEIAIQLATIGQKIKMNRALHSDGDILINIAKKIEKSKL